MKLLQQLSIYMQDTPSISHSTHTIYKHNYSIIQHDYITQKRLDWSKTNSMQFKQGPCLNATCNKPVWGRVSSTTWWVEWEGIRKWNIYINWKHECSSNKGKSERIRKAEEINIILWFNNQDNGLQNIQGRSNSYDHKFSISFLDFHSSYDKMYELYKTNFV